MITPEKILKTYWGYDNFRTPQKEIITSVLEKNDTIALLPTGDGKSVCYQVPGLILDGVCLVISPLISLMKDQVDQLTAKGIKAMSIKSGTSQNDLIALFDTVKFGKYKFLYLSPERLQSELVQQRLKDISISLIAVDEAHCISQWGHDFRPAYRNISNIKNIFSETPLIAVTATATKEVLSDIKDCLLLSDANVFTKSFHRENLSYQILQKEDKKGQLLKILQKYKVPTIIYVNSRYKTIQICKFLENHGFAATSYHGGMKKEEKDTSFNLWMHEQKPIIVATNAFGMGIDKGNVGLVIHIDLPRSLENYIQEAGRAGRNGNKAFSVVLQNGIDIYLIEQSIHNNIPDISFIKKVHQKLYENYQVSFGELPTESVNFNILEFSKKYKFYLAKLKTTLQILSNYGILEIQESYKEQSALQIIISSKAILNYKKSSTYKDLIDVILRKYSGVFQKETNIDEFWLAKTMGITSSEVINALHELHKNEIILYKASSTFANLRFLVPREDDRTINRFSKEIKTYLKNKTNKIESVTHFIKNNKICRNVQLLDYFGETTSDTCGTCDVCTSKKKVKDVNIENNIITLLEKHKGLTPEEIVQKIKAKEEDILIHLRSLLKDQKVGLSNFNKFYLK